ncbi:Major Facilitator Superfamily protein [compost metagenome]
MRLLMGSFMRNFTAQRVLIICFVLLGLGCSFLFAQNYTFLLAGMLFIGAGLAAGFPVMFAIVASKYEDLSATAISLVLVFAMVGNMLVNYLAGIVIDQYGAHSLHEMMILETVLMAALCVLLFWHLKKRALKV